MPDPIDVMNRNAYERALGALAADGRPVGVVIADVNGLKQANDNEGHAAGDRLIAETAHALANEFGREWVFRTGGDEFTVILRDHGMEEIESDVMLVKNYLSDKKVSVSIGIAFTERFGGNINALIELADKRMYEDKDRYYQMTGKAKRT